MNQNSLERFQLFNFRSICSSHSVEVEINNNIKAIFSKKPFILQTTNYYELLGINYIMNGSQEWLDKDEIAKSLTYSRQEDKPDLDKRRYLAGSLIDQIIEHQDSIKDQGFYLDLLCSLSVSEEYTEEIFKKISKLNLDEDSFICFVQSVNENKNIRYYIQSTIFNTIKDLNIGKQGRRELFNLSSTSPSTVIDYDFLNSLELKYKDYKKIILSISKGLFSSQEELIQNFDKLNLQESDFIQVLDNLFEEKYNRDSLSQCTKIQKYQFPHIAKRFLNPIANSFFNPKFSSLLTYELYQKAVLKPWFKNIYEMQDALNQGVDLTKDSFEEEDFILIYNALKGRAKRFGTKFYPASFKDLATELSYSFMFKYIEEIGNSQPYSDHFIAYDLYLDKLWENTNFLLLFYSFKVPNKNQEQFKNILLDSAKDARLNIFVFDIFKSLYQEDFFSDVKSFVLNPNRENEPGKKDFFKKKESFQELTSSFDDLILFYDSYLDYKKSLEQN